MLRPYPGRKLSGTSFSIYKHKLDDKAIFNYPLSRARRVIENSFGILAARWRVLRRPIIANPDKVRLYVQAAVALHNYLRTTESSVYCPPGYTDGEDGSGNEIDGRWRQEEDTTLGMQQIGQTGSNRFVRACTV